MRLFDYALSAVTRLPGVDVLNAHGKRGDGARDEVPLLATLSTLAGDDRGAIVNVSRMGARLTAPYLPQAGEKLIFTAEDVQAFVEVVWSRNNQGGVVFESAILPHRWDRLKRAAI